jgi:hypothetical protein
MGMDYIDNRDFHWVCNENIRDNSQHGTAEVGVVTNINIISIVTKSVIEIIILYYLYRSHVKAYFGKTTPSLASPTTLR